MFDLEIATVLQRIKEKQAKRVLIQLPDGLKPRAQEVADLIEKETGAEVMIWFGSCFGACDLPIGLNSVGIDLMVQWGHNIYHKTVKEW
ncbi:diphthamide synthesis protein [Candidatus Woesearchaeota archaeon]|nr:diphthamide synthesis protein [Candidatus Woesearchaeota archaeon]